MSSTTAPAGAAAPAKAARPRPSSRRRAVRRFIPPQHGAWAMLLLPWITGTIIAGFRWLDMVLLVGWLTGYLGSYYALLAVKTRRPARVRAQLWVYGAPTALVIALLLAFRPMLLWYAPAYAFLLAVNVAYAAARDDRALLNDLASVIQSCLMVFVCATVADVPSSRVAVAFTALTVYFIGVVLHVKSVIRERGNPRYRWGSLVYHVVAFIGAIWFGVAIAIVFALLAVRAWGVPRLKPKPGKMGIYEIVACAALLTALIIQSIQTG